MSIHVTKKSRHALNSLNEGAIDSGFSLSLGVGEEIDLTASPASPIKSERTRTPSASELERCALCDKMIPKCSFARHSENCFDEMQQAYMIRSKNNEESKEDDQQPGLPRRVTRQSSGGRKPPSSGGSSSSSSSTLKLPSTTAASAVITLSPSPEIIQESPAAAAAASSLAPGRSFISPRKATAASRASKQQLSPAPTAVHHAVSVSAPPLSTPPSKFKDEDIEMMDASPAPAVVSSALFTPSSKSLQLDSVPKFSSSTSASAALRSSKHDHPRSSASAKVAPRSPALSDLQSETDAQEHFEMVMSQMKELVEHAADQCQCRVELPEEPISFTSVNNYDDENNGGMAAAASSSSSSSIRVELVSSLSQGLSELDQAYRATLTALSQHIANLRKQLDTQAEEFVQVRLSLESHVSKTKNQQDEELSRIRIEEMIEREKETERLRRQQVAKETEWLTERLKVEEEKSKEISDLKAQAAEVANKLELLSSNNTAALMEGEAKAIETGEGELKRIRILPSEHFGGNTQEEFHFRLAESQFLRMTGGMGAYHVTSVEYILNPPLLKRYYDFKKLLKERGEPVHERLTFHGTSTKAIEAIIKEGFRIGGVDTPVLAGTALGTGVYSSESPAFAMGYIKDGRSSLLFSRVTPSKDSVIQKDGSGVIQQLVCKHREQIIPVYIVHYATGARPAKGAKAALKAAGAGFLGGLAGMIGGAFSVPVPMAPAAVAGPIILAGAPGSYVPPLRGGGRRAPKALKAPRKRKAIASPVPLPSASQSSDAEDGDDGDDDAEMKAAIAASLASSPKPKPMPSPASSTSLAIVSKPSPSPPSAAVTPVKPVLSPLVKPSMFASPKI